MSAVSDVKLDLLDEALTQITENPDEWDQASWSSCLAGWMYQLHTEEFLSGLREQDRFKEIAGIGVSLSGTLLVYDAASASLERVRVGRRPGCCG